MIRTYSHTEHFPLVKAWLTDRALPVPDPSYLPDCGFVALGIAIGFLVKTNSKVARIENLVVSPSADEKTRDAAFYELFNALETEAKRSGYSMIEVLSAGAKMTARFARCRYRKFGDYSLLFKEVT
jgi:hypothetical protein